MDKKTLAFQYVDMHKKEMIQLWEKMVCIDSSMGNKIGQTVIGQLCHTMLQKNGFVVKKIPYTKCGSAIIAERGNMKNPFILLMGHMDTVLTTYLYEGTPFTICEGKAYGSGVLDMKGGLVVLFFLIQALSAIGWDEIPMKIILDADEESNHLYSNVHDVIIKEAAGALCAFNFETGFTDHGLVVQRNGCRNFSIEVYGRSCHMGNDPENGCSAVIEMAHKIIEIEKLTGPSKHWWLNTGVISGGTVANSKPAYCKAIINLHYAKQEDLISVRKSVNTICNTVWISGTRTVWKEDVGYDVMKRTDGNIQLLRMAKRIAQENGFPIPYGKHCGGGSDAAYAVMANVPTLCAMGVEGARNHTNEEWADVNSLFIRTKQIIAMIVRLKGEFGTKYENS